MAFVFFEIFKMQCVEAPVWLLDTPLLLDKPLNRSDLSASIVQRGRIVIAPHAAGPLAAFVDARSGTDNHLDVVGCCF